MEYPLTILALVTSAETAPPLATAQTTIVDCVYDGRHEKNRRVERCKSGKVVEFGMRDWRRRLMGMRKKSDGHEKEF